MKIVNPELNKFGEDLQIGELFMLWCACREQYNAAVIRWYNSQDRLVVCSAQQPDSLGHFTVGEKSNHLHDLFRSKHEILSLFLTNNYVVLYMG